MRLLKSIIALAFLPLLMYTQGCKHQPVVFLTAEDSAICFERDILPIFVSSCAKSGCHDAITRKEGLVLNSFNGIKAAGLKPGNPADSKVYEEANGRMGAARYGNLTAEQKLLIKKWILLGAKNTTNCPVTCDSSQYKYSANIKPMIDKYCAGCHTYPNASGSVDLSSYAGVAASVVGGKLLNSLKASSNWMPKGGNKLSDCQIAQFEKWINAGAPNN
jgi:cytochrome c553